MQPLEMHACHLQTPIQQQCAQLPMAGCVECPLLKHLGANPDLHLALTDPALCLAPRMPAHAKCERAS